jgi:hypothetical protein
VSTCARAWWQKSGFRTCLSCLPNHLSITCKRCDRTSHVSFTDPQRTTCTASRNINQLEDLVETNKIVLGDAYHKAYDRLGDVRA